MHIGERLRRASPGYLVAVAGVGAAAVIAEHLDQVLNTLNISLIYLFVVLVAATSYGYGPAILASILGVFSFYLEFYPPYGVNGDLQAEDWLTLLFFLAFAVATSRLASAARARAEEERVRATEAQARQRQLALLHHLGEILQVGNDPRALAEAIVQRLREALHLRSCTIQFDGRIGVPASAATAGVAGDGSPIPFLLQCGGNLLGTLYLEQQPDRPSLGDGELQVLATFVEQAAVAIERTALAAEAHQAEVLREADRLKTSLLRLISHDLRTPLATIKARATNLLDEDITVDSTEWRESMRAIDTEADRLERLVAEVLELSRIEADALSLRKELYTADEVVSTVLPHLEKAAVAHRLIVDVPDDLPPVELDITLISRVLANLLENAFKYAPAGTAVRLSAVGRDGGLLLRVEDEGPGIPEDLRERVFDAFYRVDSVDRPLKQSAHGVGLGLAICRGLVVAHGGWIRVEESSSNGATFLVWLPGGKRQSAAGSTPQSAAIGATLSVASLGVSA